MSFLQIIFWILGRIESFFERIRELCDQTFLHHEDFLEIACILLFFLLFMVYLFIEQIIKFFKKMIKHV
jgi:hypothetical protein